MIGRGFALAATVLAIECLAGCPARPAPRGPEPAELDDTAVRIRIANAEARR
ncbi:MAG: hypothetical protein H0X17_20925, partial [Deltaproteobacteria bacterium]|nr:hypothetical protein [Deltaproteobacteria bacterium]